MLCRGVPLCTPRCVALCDAPRSAARLPSPSSPLGHAIRRFPRLRFVYLPFRFTPCFFSPFPIYPSRSRLSTHPFLSLPLLPLSPSHLAPGGALPRAPFASPGRATRSGGARCVVMMHRDAVRYYWRWRACGVRASCVHFVWGAQLRFLARRLRCLRRLPCLRVCLLHPTSCAPSPFHPYAACCASFPCVLACASARLPMLSLSFPFLSLSNAC